MNYIMWYDSVHLWIAMSVNLKTRGSHLHFGSDSFEILQKIFSIFPSQCFPPYLSLCSCSVGQNVFIPYIEAIIMSGRFYSFGVPYKLLGGERYSYQSVLPGQHEDSKLHLSESNLEKRQQHSKPPIMKSEFSLLRSRQFWENSLCVDVTSLKMTKGIYATLPKRNNLPPRALLNTRTRLGEINILKASRISRLDQK